MLRMANDIGIELCAEQMLQFWASYVFSELAWHDEFLWLPLHF
jgi:hypothetical protein